MPAALRLVAAAALVCASHALLPAVGPPRRPPTTHPPRRAFLAGAAPALAALGLAPFGARAEDGILRGYYKEEVLQGRIFLIERREKALKELLVLRSLKDTVAQFELSVLKGDFTYLREVVRAPPLSSLRKTVTALLPLLDNEERLSCQAPYTAVLTNLAGVDSSARLSDAAATKTAYYALVNNLAAFVDATEKAVEAMDGSNSPDPRSTLEYFSEGVTAVRP